MKLKSPFKLSPAQSAASEKLLEELKNGAKRLTLMGVTGSGKTFTLARVIEKWNRPVLVISHNKTLAAQLYTELKTFFPENAVCYFVSYYDYYQPEAYIPQSDTYIAKDASINEQIDRLRLQATASLLSRKDVIIVATVSCIYGIGSPDDWSGMLVKLAVGEKTSPFDACKNLASIRYERNSIDFSPGKFRLNGNTLDVFPPYADNPYRIEWNETSIVSIREFDKTSFEKRAELSLLSIYPAKYFVTTENRRQKAVAAIRKELKERIKYFNEHAKPLEAERIKQRTEFDIEMLIETGYCHGIENYSRHFSGRRPGEPPYCLINYFPKDFLTIIDESHVTVPQLRGMWAGDYSRKMSLVDFGFRLPSALDNRPLKFNEFYSILDSVIFSSATPADYEIRESGIVVEQLIRPTGLVDPQVFVRPMKNAPADIFKEILNLKKRGERALIITLTKRMAEDLSSYFISKGIKTHYLHSDIATLERVSILNDLRKGNIDCIVGVNLLREGIDLPEVSLVAILDTDKEGFLRSRTSLIQISGRAARNVSSRIIFYAESVTGSMKEAMKEMARRRCLQIAYNKKHRITPRSIVKDIFVSASFIKKSKSETYELLKDNLDRFSSSSPQVIKALKKDLKEASDNLDFEMAIILRDKILSLGGKLEYAGKKC